ARRANPGRKGARPVAERQAFTRHPRARAHSPDNLRSSALDTTGAQTKAGATSALHAAPTCPFRRNGLSDAFLGRFVGVRAGGLPPERRLEPDRSSHVKYRQARRCGLLDVGADTPRRSDRTLSPTF